MKLEEFITAQDYFVILYSAMTEEEQEAENKKNSIIRSYTRCSAEINVNHAIKEYTGDIPVYHYSIDGVIHKLASTSTDHEKTKEVIKKCICETIYKLDIAKESSLEALLGRLKKQPYFEERQEYGRLLMIHIDALNPVQRARYDYLKEFLRNKDNGTN